MVLTLTIIGYGFLSAMSGTLPYESTLYGLFNFALGWPIVILGLIDTDVEDSFAMLHPEVYATGRKNTQLGLTQIVLWLSNAVSYAVIFLLVIYIALAQTLAPLDIFEAGLFTYHALLQILQAKVALMFHQVQWVVVFFFALSIFGGLGVYHLLSNWDDFGSPSGLPHESVPF